MPELPHPRPEPSPRRSRRLPRSRRRRTHLLALPHLRHRRIWAATQQHCTALEGPALRHRSHTAASRANRVRQAKALGIEPARLAQLCFRLWGGTFSEERDRRAGPHANAQKRGRVARELRAELVRKPWLMATISKYQTASGATLYRVRYRTPDRGQTDKRGFATKCDAEAFANSVEVRRPAASMLRPR